MRAILLVGAVLALAVPTASAGTAPGTSLTITAWSVGGRSMHVYRLTCAPASVRGPVAGTLRAADACAALREIGARIYLPALSARLNGCNYIQAPPRAAIVGTRNGRRVRTAVQVGGCERPLVPARLVQRVVRWPAPAVRA